MRHWLGPWVWEVPADGEPFWRAPTGTRELIDLRSLADQGTPGPTALGNGLFITDDLTDLGADYLEVPETFNPLARARIRNKLGLSQVVIAGGRAGFVLELLTRHADVTGATFCRPLMPNRLGRLRLALANREVDDDHEITLASPFWAKVQTALQEQYREYRTRALAGDAPENFHRRWLTVQLEKFAGRIDDYHAFIPVDLPDESPLPHNTTLTESFDKADNGLGPDQTWTNVAGTYGVNSNAAQCQATGRARAEADVSTTDHSCEADWTVLGGFNTDVLPTARYSSSADTCYGLRYSAPNLAIYKYVTGTPTALATGGITPSLPETYKLECNGSSLAGYQAGVSRVTVTDTAITTGTRGGLNGVKPPFGTLPKADNWVLSDLAAPSGRIFKLAGEGGGLVGPSRGLVARHVSG